MLESVENCVMLRTAANEVTPASLMTARQAENSKIVRLGSAPGEDQFVRFRAE